MGRWLGVGEACGIIGAAVMASAVMPYVHNIKEAPMLTHPNFDPVALSLGPISVHWYGLMYLLAFASAWGLAMRRAKFSHTALERNQVDDLIFYGAIGVVLGGRFGYVLFYNFDRFLQEPLWLLKVWEGGMSFHGGMLGVLVAGVLYARHLKVGRRFATGFYCPHRPHRPWRGAYWQFYWPGIMGPASGSGQCALGDGVSRRSRGPGSPSLAALSGGA